MSEAYIVGAVRTPMGRGKADGSLHGLHPSDLGAIPLKELVKRAEIAPEVIEDVIYGCVTPVGEQGLNIARTSVLAAGFPITVPGVQINRMCGSGQQAVTFAASSVSAGTYDVAVGGGVEMMGRVTMGSDAGPIAESIQDRFDIINQGVSAELIAEKWDLSREELDAFALESHRKADEAQKAGYFEAEIVPVELADGTVFDKDETIRPGTSMEKMASLRTVFKDDGVVTAASSSQITDGAAAVLLANEEGAQRHGLRRRARIVKTAVVGSDPTIMLTGPIPATRKVLEKAGLTVDDIDLFEINEAFAPVVLAWARDLEVPAEKTNVNGGAIALGHPLGGTGGRLIATLLHELERRQARYGLVTMCIGFGQATATIIERLDG
jgi:acetyl-CoA acetyltransferase family protein